MLFFNIHNKTLLSESGELIKQLACPYPVQEVRLVRENARQVSCKGCERSLVMAHALPESELIELMQAQPKTCLLIDHHAPNIQIIEETSP